MADFYQTGVVTTLHRLKPDSIERLELDLESFCRNRPIGLVLPALYSEFETPAMQTIVPELRKVKYLERIVLVLGRASKEQYLRACGFFKDFYTPVTVIWVDSARIQGLLATLETRGLSAGKDGKGRSCWLAYGYLLAKRDCDVIALHDCDIVNYDRQLLARLCYPLVHPHLGFEFCKGYYARVTSTMHGRVTRLFMNPLIRSVEGMAPGTPFLKFLDSFRYPLAGEFAMDASLARVNRVPADWGLEVRYVRLAQDTIARYYADAMINGLKFDRHGEEMAVATFAESLKRAAIEFIAEPRGLPLIPNWNRVLSAIPEFFELLIDAVERDTKEA